MASDNRAMVGTTGHLMSFEAMKAIIWAGWALCVAAFCARSYIRWLCFRRFLPEDWLMFFVLGIMLASAVITQLRLQYIYEMVNVGNGAELITPTFLDELPITLHFVFAQVVTCTTGIYIIKLSFLIFFYRLGHAITKYLIFWWAVALFTLASYGITMGLIESKCTLSGLDVVLIECGSPPDIARQWKSMIAYCTLDAVSDVLILCLPITILWNVRLTLRKKLILAGVFSLTMFTVAVTIIRGTIQNGRIAHDFTQSQNIAWVHFWISIEFITAYIIACLVSFRMLFVHKEKTSSARALAYRDRNNYNPHSPNYYPRRSPLDPSTGPKRSSRRKRTLLDSLLDTLHGLEGTTRHGGDEFVLDKTVPSGRLSVDFMEYQAGGGGGSGGGGDIWPLQNDKPRPDSESAKTLLTPTMQEAEEEGGPARPEAVRTVGDETRWGV